MLLQRSIKIRGLEISPPLALAPMVGLSHSALRGLVKKTGGCGLFFTEMLAAKRLPHDSEKHSPLLIRSSEERPLFYQLICGDEKYVHAALEKVSRLGADGVDLNLGCPAPLQRKQGAGAALSRDLPRLRRVLHEIRMGTELPLSVKIRLGDNENNNGLVPFCSFLQDQGVDLITIHARFYDDKFCRKPRWPMVREVKKNLTIPLLVNGGIFSVADGRRCLEESGGDGLMLGRGAVIRPWLLRDLAMDLYGEEQCLCGSTKADIYFFFVSLLEERFPVERQLGRLKQFTSYYAQSYPFGHHLASRMQSCDSMESATTLAREFFQARKCELEIQEN